MRAHIPQQLHTQLLNAHQPACLPTRPTFRHSPPPCHAGVLRRLARSARAASATWRCAVLVQLQEWVHWVTPEAHTPALGCVVTCGQLLCGTHCSHSALRCLFEDELAKHAYCAMKALQQVAICDMEGFPWLHHLCISPSSPRVACTGKNLQSLPSSTCLLQQVCFRTVAAFSSATIAHCS